MDAKRKNELSEAMRALTSLQSKCEKIIGKFSHGTAQHTLLQRRIAALRVAIELIERELSSLAEEI